MEELRRIKRESSSPLAPILAAKSVDELLDMFMAPASPTEESTEALDEIIRRAVFYTEAKERAQKVMDSYKNQGHTGKPMIMAPDHSAKGH